VPKWAARASVVFREIDAFIMLASDDSLCHHNIADPMKLEELANFCGDLWVGANAIILPVSELGSGVRGVDNAGDDTIAVLIVWTIIGQRADGIIVFCLQDFQELIR